MMFWNYTDLRLESTVPEHPPLRLCTVQLFLDLQAFHICGCTDLGGGVEYHLMKPTPRR